MIGEISRPDSNSMSDIPTSFKYKDVVRKGFPKHEGWDWFRRKHPPMPASRWAKIYAPFDALKGFDDAISSKEVTYVDRVRLDDGRKQELSRRLSILQRLIWNNRQTYRRGIPVTVEFFVSCTDPDHFAYELHLGQYQTRSGMVQCVDAMQQTLTLQAEEGKAVIDFDDILSIEPQQDGLFDSACPDDRRS